MGGTQAQQRSPREDKRRTPAKSLTMANTQEELGHRERFVPCPCKHKHGQMNTRAEARVVLTARQQYSDALCEEVLRNGTRLFLQILSIISTALNQQVTVTGVELAAAISPRYTTFSTHGIRDFAFSFPRGIEESIQMLCNRGRWFHRGGHGGGRSKFSMSCRRISENFHTLFAYDGWEAQCLSRVNKSVRCIHVPKRSDQSAVSQTGWAKPS